MTFTVVTVRRRLADEMIAAWLRCDARDLFRILRERGRTFSQWHGAGAYWQAYQCCPPNPRVASQLSCGISNHLPLAVSHSWHEFLPRPLLSPRSSALPVLLLLVSFTVCPLDASNAFVCCFSLCSPPTFSWESFDLANRRNLTKVFEAVGYSSHVK